MYSLFFRKEVGLADTLEMHPAESINWRKHKNACPFYRVRWFPGNDVMAGEPMYQVFCLKNTPPVTLEEQDRCMHSKTCCWRLREKQQAAAKESSTAKETSLPS